MVIVLAVITAIVLFGAVYSRWILNITQKKREKVKENLSDSVVQYTFADLSFDDLKKKLRTKHDYIILLSIVNKTMLSVSGEEKERLTRLLSLQPIREYFTSRFKSRDQLERSKACLYFSKQKRINSSHLPIILKYTDEGYPMLCYSAAMAIIAHGSEEQKKTAIENLLANEGLSNQALNDVFVEFQDHATDDGKFEAETLMEFISDRRFSENRTALLIRVLGELSYYESADFLLNEYLALPAKLDEPEVAVSLINALANFGMIEIVDRIHTDFVNSEYREVREACVISLSGFLMEESIPVLKWMLYDNDFYVRFYAAKSLSIFPDISLENLKPISMNDESWNELLGEVELMKEDMI